MRLFAMLLLLSAPSVWLRAEVSLAGVPEQIFPGMLRDWAVSYANDSTVYDRDDRFRKHDDFRTTSLSGFYRLNTDYLCAFDFSLLTDKQGNRRNDELSLSLGRQWSTPAEHESRFQAQAGLGLRLADDFGGQDIQNSLHTFTSGIDVKMPYDDSDSAVFIFARTQWIKEFNQHWQVDTRHALLLDSQGLLQLDLHLRQNLLLSPVSSLSAGLRWRDHVGDGLHDTADRVLEAEDHWWIQLGTHWRMLGLQFEHHPSSSRSQLMLSLAASH